MNDRKTNEINEIHRVPQKTNESQHSAVIYFDKCFSSLCLLCNTTTSTDLFKQMFKMPPFGFHTSKKTLSPLAYGCVDDALVDSFPDCSSAFTQFVDVADGLLIHVFLNYRLQILQSTGFKSGLFGGHRDGEMKSGTSFSSSSTVGRAR